MDKRIRLLVIIVIILVGGLIAWNIGLSVTRRGLDKITIDAIPDDSSVTMDGQPIHEGDIYVKPGTHTLVASRKYFDTVTQKINTADYKNGDTIYLLPLPNSPEAMNWLNSHPAVQAARESAAGAVANQLQKRQLAKWPIIAKLPAYNSHYRIDYSVEGDDISFQVTLYPIINGPADFDNYKAQYNQYKSEAVKFLKDNKIDPAQYDVTFTPSDPND